MSDALAKYSYISVLGNEAEDFLRPPVAVFLGECLDGSAGRRDMPEGFFEDLVSFKNTRAARVTQDPTGKMDARIWA